MKYQREFFCLNVFLVIILLINCGSYSSFAINSDVCESTTQNWIQVIDLGNFTQTVDSLFVISNNTGDELQFIRNSSGSIDYHQEHYVFLDEGEFLNCTDFFVEVNVAFEFQSFNESGNIKLEFLSSYDSNSSFYSKSIGYLSIYHQESNNMTNYSLEYTHTTGGVCGSRPMDSYPIINEVIFRANRTGSTFSLQIVDPSSDTIILSDQTGSCINSSLNHILIDYKTNSRNDNFNATVSDCFMMLEINATFPTLPPTSIPSYPTGISFSIGFSSIPALAVMVGILFYSKSVKKRK